MGLSKRDHIILLFFSTLYGIAAFKENSVRLRHRWENRPPTSTIAKKIHENQNNCALDKGSMALNQYGMGSGLISLSHAMCTALQLNQHVTLHPDYKVWIWNDVEFCKTQPNNGSELTCYFGPVFNTCAPKLEGKGLYWVNFQKCPSYVNHPGNVKASFAFHGAVFEYIFSQVNPEIVRRAELEAAKVFGPKGSPSDMITVHIRWGDKTHEMGGSLVHINEYVEAVHKLIRTHHLSETDVNIFLTSEDPKAVLAFKSHSEVVAKKWKVHMYNAAVSPNPHPSMDAESTQGRFGLISLIVLLLSMESRYYVITTASNWSVLIEALRLGVVDQDCGGNCTDSIDLRRNPLGKDNIDEYNRISNQIQ